MSGRPAAAEGLHRTDQAPVPRFPWTGFLVLASVVVLCVTTETMPTGLLPDMSASLGVSRPQIGLLVTIFAFTVAATSIPLVALTRRLQRQHLIVAAIVLLAVSNLFTSLAPGYGAVVAARVVGGIAHGAFWATVGAYAGHAVAREQIGRAVAVTLGGATVGFIFGVPLATVLGHALGWRVAFATVGVLLLVGAAFAWRFLPVVRPIPRERNASPSKDPSIRPVLIVCGTALFIMVGHYAFYTYIAPFAIDVLGIDPGFVGPLLFLTGIAGAIGLILAGTVLASRSTLGLTLSVLVSAVAVSIVAAFAHDPWIALPALFLWSAALGMLPPLLQTRLLHVSSAAFRDTGNSIYTATFNIGIGGGALVGALLYGSVGLSVLPWLYVGVLVVSLVLIAAARERVRMPS